MKKILLTLILVFILGITNVLADLEVSDVKLGDDNQDRAQVATRTVTVKNTGNSSINDVTVSFSGVDSKFNVSGELSSDTVPAGGSITLTIRGFVPLDLDAVDSAGRPEIHDIGDVLIEGDSESATVDLLMQAENKLRFGGDTEIVVDGDSEDLDDGDTYEAKRGDNVEFNIEVENRFNDKGDCQEDGEDCEIQDVEVEIDSDRDLDFDDDLNFGDIRSDDQDTDSFDFTIDNDIDDGDYEVELWVTGEDENGALHGERFEFEIEIDVPRDEVSIERVDLSPETLECNERSTRLSVKLENTGRDDQDKVSIIVDSVRLDIKESLYNIDVDEGDVITKVFDLELPEDAEPGRYFIKVIANVDSEETDEDAAELVLRECREEVEEEEEPEETDVNIIEIPPTAGVIYGKPTEKGFLQSNAFLLLLGAVFLALIVLIVVLLAVLLQK